jgi:hypothetical protein
MNTTSHRPHHPSVRPPRRRAVRYPPTLHILPAILPSAVAVTSEWRRGAWHFTPPYGSAA